MCIRALRVEETIGEKVKVASEAEIAARHLDDAVRERSSSCGAAKETETGLDGSSDAAGSDAEGQDVVAMFMTDLDAT